MIYYMNSEEFEKYFLPYESDKDILNSQYVLASLRIRKRDNLDNVIACQILFPSSHVCATTNDDDFKERYFKQLDENKALFASFIKGSIEENYNIIFLCTKNEDKMGYLYLISRYIEDRFHYPCYNYFLYTYGGKLKKYNKQKVLKKCDRILNEAAHNNCDEKKLRKFYKDKPKKYLIKLLKDHDLYQKGMDKEDMIDSIIIFHDDIFKK